MHNKAGNKQKELLESNLLANSAHIKTKKDLEIYYNKHKHKLPPILQSKHMFMIQLINQEVQANIEMTNRHYRQATQRNKTDQAQFKQQQKSNARNTVRLTLSPGKIIFNVENPRKLRRNYLVSYSSVERQKRERLTVQRCKQKQLEAQNKSPKMYSKRKQNNPFYVNKICSQSLFQLVEKVESCKKIYEENSLQNLLIHKTLPKSQMIQKGEIDNVGESVKKKEDNKDVKIFPQSNSSLIRSHLKTCIFEKLNKNQFQRYASRDLDKNLSTKRDKKLKVALTKPIESSLRIRQHTTPNKSHFQTIYHEIEVQPWQDQEPQYQEYNSKFKI